MKKRTIATCTGAAALLLAAFATSPAQAAPTAYAGCTTTGASGAVKITNWHGPGARVGLEFNLSDIEPDNHHVRIRLISEQYNGKRVNWPWRKNFGGSGTTETWTSSASDDAGLHELGVQVARFEGDRLLNSCTDWV
ncbi:hypothetical protein ACFY9S_15865 [Streptomyces sp. NPDC012474]|uniref:hypothetical protein n=1 Tax=Streptomyces sp. NPDC012474 TaxID=3364836 RepID=UPI0036EFC02C